MNPNPQPTAPEPSAPPSSLADIFQSPTPSPAAPASPSPAPSDAFSGTFGIDVGASPAVQPASPATPAPSAPGNAAPPATPAGLTVEDFVSRYVADPDALFKGDDRKISSFKELRGLFSGATKELAAAQLEISRLRQTAPATEGGAAVLPETDAVAQLTAQIEALKPAAQKWQEIEAREALAQNPAFRHEFDAPRAAILREMGEAADEIGLEGKDVEEFLRLDSEYKQAKWIKDRIDDDVAAQLFKEKGRAFLGHTQSAKSALDATDPISALREWEDYQHAFASKFAAKLGENAARELQSATSRIVGQLAGGDDPFFGTDSGKAVLAELNRRASEGQGFSADEVVEAFAMAQSASAYQALAQTFQQRLLAAEQEVSRLKGMSPNPMPPDPLRSPGQQTPSHLYGFGSGGGGGGIKPLVTAEQIRVMP